MRPSKYKTFSSSPPPALKLRRAGRMTKDEAKNKTIMITENMSRTERVREFKKLLGESSLQFDTKLAVMKRAFRRDGLLSSKYTQVLDSSTDRITVYLRRVSRTSIEVVPTIWISFPRGYWELIGSFPQGVFVFDEHFFQQLPHMNNNGASMQTNVERILFTKGWDAAMTPGGTPVFKHENYVALGTEQDGYINWNAVMAPGQVDDKQRKGALWRSTSVGRNQLEPLSARLGTEGVPDMDRIGQMKRY